MYQLNNVSFTYENSEGDGSIRDVDLTLHAGECVLICGESGCGKTTLLRLLNGLIPYYYRGQVTGDVLLNGESLIGKKPYELAGHVGTVFQNPKSQFFAVNTAEELAFGCENLGLPREETLSRIDDVTEEFGIQALISKSLFALSGGEKQKVACASVSAMLPDIIILDEPSSNLDEETVESLRAAIAQWKSQGKTIIAAEHRLYYWLGLADRVLYMREGQIELDMPAADFFDMPAARISSLGLRSLFPVEKRLVEKQIPADTQCCLKLSDISFTYKHEKRAALRIPSCMLPTGEIIALVGHNGAGKSTFVRCMCGFERHMKGQVAFAGQVFKGRKMAPLSFMVMQNVEHQLFAESVIEEICLSMQGKTEEEKIEIAEDLLSEFNLLHKKDTHPLALSGGEKQRVAIMCALASDKRFLFFDEPTSGLDYRHMMIVAEQLQKLQRMGKTVFLITHDKALIANCCTYCLEICKGEIREQGSLSCKAQLSAVNA